MNKAEQSQVNGSSSTEVKVKESRRRFSQVYREQIIKELDEAPHGQKGVIMRREGLYAKTVERWRTEIKAGVVVKKRGLTRRGRKSSTQAELKKKLLHSEGRIKRLERKLKQAELIIDVQKKLSAILSADQAEEQT